MESVLEEHDNDGNMLTTVQSGSRNWSMGWDYENRMNSWSNSISNRSQSYKYDPFGRRIQKVYTNAGVTTTTNYLYDGANKLEELDQNGTVVARYTQGLGVDEPLAMLRANATTYFEQDGLGTVTSLTNTSGALSDTFTYATNSFGNISTHTGSTYLPERFTGREYDETGLYYYRARFYDPVAARFTSEDPIGFGGRINFYAYVRNRPTLSTDPSGLVDVTPLPSDHIHILPNINQYCGITAGGCNRVDYRPDFVCEQVDCKWKARFTVRLVGDIYVAAGPFPYQGRQPADRSIRDTASAIRHETLHTNDKLNAILGVFRPIESMAFDSKAACENAAANAEVQAATAWAQAALSSQRNRD